MLRAGVTALARPRRPARAAPPALRRVVRLTEALGSPLALRCISLEYVCTPVRLTARAGVEFDLEHWRSALARAWHLSLRRYGGKGVDPDLRPAAPGQVGSQTKDHSVRNTARWNGHARYSNQSIRLMRLFRDRNRKTCAGPPNMPIEAERPTSGLVSQRLRGSHSGVCAVLARRGAGKDRAHASVSAEQAPRHQPSGGPSA